VRGLFGFRDGQGISAEVSEETGARFDSVRRKLSYTASDLLNWIIDRLPKNAPLDEGAVKTGLDMIGKVYGLDRVADTIPRDKFGRK
jgi:hypothetical protein